MRLGLMLFCTDNYRLACRSRISAFQIKSISHTKLPTLVFRFYFWHDKIRQVFYFKCQDSWSITYSDKPLTEFNDVITFWTVKYREVFVSTENKPTLYRIIKYEKLHYTGFFFGIRLFPDWYHYQSDFFHFIIYTQ